MDSKLPHRGQTSGDNHMHCNIEGKMRAEQELIIFTLVSTNYNAQSQEDLWYLWSEILLSYRLVFENNLCRPRTSSWGIGPRQTWQSVVNRAVRMLSSGPLGSHFGLRQL
ncbi:hypothetical protein KIN20_005737 [Parelaphostrongylus tenuis]|uniref:Uncharacterized protein n=1 Tax=Parelaphostrongylus tenuis TaxID=148309 RepID=A0AAD5QHR0_PARTN|nr:hypothetical protein KIN20_005737 [Parelaphostrongylus tenuis]